MLAALLHALRHSRPGVGVLAAAGPIAQGVRTNLRPLEIRELAQLVATVDLADIKTMTLDDSGLLEAQSGPAGDVVVPVDGNYLAIQRFVAAQLP